MTEERLWKVGELAAVAGLTVRTLHHWDEIGLLSPRERSGAGYRLYGVEEARRLQRILALRQLGLDLEQVGAALDGAADPLELVRGQLAALDRQIELAQRLRALLLRTLEAPQADDPIATIEVMTMIDRHYTPEQLEALARRREDLGTEGMEGAQREWAELIAAMEAERERGAEPGDPRVQELAGRWAELVEAFTGGDPGIAASLRRMYAEEGPEPASRGMVNPELMEFVARARAAAEGAG